MDYEFDFSAVGEDNLVYIRAIERDSLPKDVQCELPDTGELFAVHRADGEPLAIAPSRAMAFVVARQNDYSPVNVH